MASAPDIARAWECFAWTPGAEAITELTEAVGRPKALGLLDSTAQRQNTVESDLFDGETLLDLHRRRARA